MKKWRLQSVNYEHDNEILHIVIYKICNDSGKTKHVNYNAIPCSIAITK